MLFYLASTTLFAVEPKGTGPLLRQILGDPVLFNTNTTAAIVELAKAAPIAFTREVVVGKGTVKAKVGDKSDSLAESAVTMFRGLQVSAALAKAVPTTNSGSSHRASFMVGEADDGSVVCLGVVLKTNLFAPGVSVSTFRKRLGQPEQTNIVKWASAEIAETVVPPIRLTTGEPETVFVYFGGAFGISEHSWWMDGAKFVQALGLVTDVSVSSPKSLEQIASLKKAGEDGDATACFTLAGIYFRGTGVPTNRVEAMDWYTKAAVAGHAESAYNLGTILEFGLGVPPDRAAAVMWYRLAAGRGHAEAKQKVQSLDSK